eukprot:1135-Heterococcus_DN1.PRE.7
MPIELLTPLIRLPQAIQGFCNNVGITAPQCEQTIKPQLLSTIREKLASGKVRQLFVKLSGLVNAFPFLGNPTPFSGNPNNLKARVFMYVYLRIGNRLSP